MRKCIESGSQQAFRILAREDMRRDAQAALVRLIDDRSIEVGSELLIFAVPVSTGLNKIVNL